jgi:hypothetical protein
MAIVPIKSRPDKHILLDDEVDDIIGHWGWRLRRDGYLQARIPGQRPKEARIGRAVIWAVTGEWPPAGMQVDHINHNPLDNRIENLRVVTRSINNRNQLKREGIRSQYKGIHYHNQDKLFQGRATISLNGVRKEFTGAWTKDERIAGMTADCIWHKIGGFLNFNFPDMPFNDKWEKIGEPQRKRIMACMKRHGLH